MSDESEDKNREMSELIADIDSQITSIRARMWKGDYDEVVEQRLHEAHDLASRINHLPLQTQTLRLLGSLAYLVMNLDLAKSYMHKALALAMRLQDTAQMLSLGANLGFIYRAKGDPQAAVRHFQPFVDKLDMVDITPELVRPATTVLLRYIVCLLLTHDYKNAEKRLNQVEPLLAQYDTGENPQEAAAFIAYLAFGWVSVYLEQENYEMARQYCILFDFANRQLGRPADVILTSLLYLRLTLLPDQPEERQEMHWRNMLTHLQPHLIQPYNTTALHHIAQYGFLEEADYYAVHGRTLWARRCAEQALEIFTLLENQAMIATTLQFLEELAENGSIDDNSPES